MSDDIEWRVEAGLLDYRDGVAAMEARAAAIHAGTARELIWLVEHPAVYTAGTSARASDLLDPRFPVVATGRGGQFTYHGPGQRVVYVLLDLTRRGRDVRQFVAALEAWIIAALATIGIPCRTIAGQVGVWTGSAGDPAKIAAIGVRIKRWVTLHGAAINIAPDLDHFRGIVPCGLPGARVTSVADLTGSQGLTAVDVALAERLDLFLARLAVQPRAMSLEEGEFLG